jgi:hypothetical protein
MGWYEGLKDAVKIAQQADNLELLKTLLDSQAGALALQEENAGLRRECEALREQIKIKEKLIPFGNAYWTDKDGPFCTGCWDNNGKLIRLLLRLAPTHNCPVCGSQPDVTERPSRTRRIA